MNWRARYPKRRTAAFTLLELLTVIVILIILIMFSLVAFQKIKTNAKLTRVSTELEQIHTAVVQYSEDNNYQYPPDVVRGVPPGLERYLQGGTWPTSVWPHGVFDWDNILSASGEHIYQITYRLCDLNDPIAYCSDPVLFPSFGRDSSIFYCISGPCIPHASEPTIPGYCVNCKPHEQNY